eukprot:8376-Heterococcus_DN1.PRE.2
MRRLDCVVQKYAWGKRGGSSKVAQLKQCESSDYELQLVHSFKICDSGAVLQLHAVGVHANIAQ